MKIPAETPAKKFRITIGCAESLIVQLSRFFKPQYLSTVTALSSIPLASTKISEHILVKNKQNVLLKQKLKSLDAPNGKSLIKRTSGQKHNDKYHGNKQEKAPLFYHLQAGVNAGRLSTKVFNLTKSTLHCTVTNHFNYKTTDAQNNTTSHTTFINFCNDISSRWWILSTQQNRHPAFKKLYRQTKL